MYGVGDASAVESPEWKEIEQVDHVPASEASVSEASVSEASVSEG